MMHRKFVRASLFALLVGVVTIGPAGPSWSAARAAGPSPARGAPAPAQTVTLITGDRVTVTDGGSGAVSVSPGKGRTGRAYLTQRVSGHLSVLPSDAMSLVGSGRLDRRLFDVTTLLAFGYGDAQRPDLPLIVQYPQAAVKASTQARLSAGASVARNLTAARALAVRESKGSAVDFWSAVTTAMSAPGLAPGIDRIWLDGKRQVQLDQSVAQVGAPAAWAAGYTGQGVTVGVVDTGIDVTHPDLAGKVIAAQNFTDAPDADDQVGHGTHVASIITGSGAASGGEYRGMAPDVKLVSAKVCSDIWCDESAILAGLQWAAAEQHAKVVNVSIGGGDTPQLDPLEEAVNTLTAQQGTLFVISAGNSGPGPQSVSSPGSADAALTVAAVTKTDQVAEFSSRGPRVGDGAIKPDIAAPGVDIVAARARNAWIGDPVNDSYLRLSGTSMAAPHVAGAAALLAGEHSDWSPALLKAALMGSSTTLPGVDLFAVGAGRLDVGRAVVQPVIAEPPSLSLGLQLWPHSDDPPVVRTLTYRNVGAVPLTVNLSAEVTAPYGGPAPAGMFTLSTTVLTVPANGSGAVTLTADTRTNAPIGAYTGRVNATVNGQPLTSTPLTLQVEPERYGLTLRHIDGAGNPAEYFYTDLLRVGMYDEYYVSEQSATVTLRVPKATYLLGSVITTGADTREQRQTLFGYPLLTVDRDMTIDLDVRQAKGVTLSVPDAQAVPMAVSVGFDARLGWTDYSWQLQDQSGAVTTRQLGPQPSRAAFVGRVEAVLSRKGATSPYRYNLAWYTPGSFWTGFSGSVRANQLAVVHETYGAPVSGLSAQKSDAPYPTINDWMSPGWLSAEQYFDVPATGTEYFMTSDVRWRQELSVVNLNSDVWQYLRQSTNEPVTYRAGRGYEAVWNGAVVGPSSVGHPVNRTWGELTGWIPMFSDGTPGHLGDGSFDTARTALYRDGQLIGESAEAGAIYASVPAAAASYRLTADVTRTADISTRISAAWTFESGFTGAEWSAVPIMTARFSPPVDAKNTAPAGRPFVIPLTVDGAINGVSTVAVQASYDGGTTWLPASLTRTKDGWRATLTHPAPAGDVALRIQATDGAHNTMEETIISAYHIA